jgi:hypothetical protein
MNPTTREKISSLHSAALSLYRAGCREPEKILEGEGAIFFQSQGLSLQFLYDCVDDLEGYGEPDLATFLELCRIRADHFQNTLAGRPAVRRVEECELPPKNAQWDGVAWLPRIIRKAQCFLAGCLCPEIMYGCAGDRAFLQAFGATLPGFLEVVRDSEGDPATALRHLRGAPAQN